MVRKGSRVQIPRVAPCYNTIMNKKELTLSKDKKILGVAGGIAEYFDTDPAWIRIVALILIISTGVIPGLIVYYIIGKAIMPEPKSSK